MPDPHHSDSVATTRPASAARFSGTPSRTSFRWVALLAAFLPALVMGLLVERFAVNIPQWDDWERGPLLKKWHDGELNWNDLYAPHIEHRIVVQRLVMLACHALADGDVRAEIGVVFAITLGTALALAVLLRRSFRWTGPKDAGIGILPFALTLFCINLLVFSALQWQNFLWAIQVALVTPMFAITLALVALGTRWRPEVKWIACFGCALVATHGFGHGILVWPAVLLAVLLGRTFVPSPKAKALFAGAWLAAGAAATFAYYHPSTFRNASHHSHTYNIHTGETPRAFDRAMEALERPDKVAEFTMATLGNTFARTVRGDTLESATVAGVALVALFAGLAGHWLWRRRDHGLWEASLPWLALGGVAISAALMMALARTAGMAVDRSISPRYIGITLYLSVAVLVLAVLHARAFVRDRPDARGAAWLSNAGLLAAGFLIAIKATQWDYGYRAMQVHHAARMHARTNLMFINLFEPDHVKRLDANYAFLREQANVLHELGYLDVPLLPDTRLSHFRLATSPLSPSRARFLELYCDDAGNVTARGFASLPATAGRPADGILLVARDEHGERRVIAVADRHHLPELHIPHWDYEFDAIREFAPGEFSLWSKTFALSDLPAGGDAIEIEAWAVDSDSLRVYRLPDRHIIRPADGTVDPVAAPETSG